MTAPRYVEPDASARRADRAKRMECRICWYVYDPADGDDVWQIPAGTPFADLPSHWTCPGCSATQDQFLALRDE
jgi:rubredoxin